MRIAVAMYGQETSSFSPVPTTLDTFRLYGLFAGDEVLQNCPDGSSLGGFIDVMNNAGIDWTPLPIVYGWAGASGALTDEALQYFADQLDSALRDAPPLDGFYF